MSYEAGSQVALGLELCANMDARHRAEGRAAWFTGDVSKLWSQVHWAGYQEASTWQVSATVFPGAPSDWVTEEELAEIQRDCPRLITYIDKSGLPAEDRDDWVGE